MHIKTQQKQQGKKAIFGPNPTIANISFLLKSHFSFILFQSKNIAKYDNNIPKS